MGDRENPIAYRLVPIAFFTGPWKPVSGEGRARRGEPVIMAKKIDVNVNSTGILGIYGQNGENNHS